MEEHIKIYVTSFMNETNIKYNHNFDAVVQKQFMTFIRPLIYSQSINYQLR
jgi:hypothetical protein